MRDRPPSAAGSYAMVGVVVTVAGGVAMVAGTILDWPASALVVGGVTAFVGVLTIELTRRLWDP